ncbi:hypothetical protein [Streptomyces profundus]|uniref:hypothetical protein n=1 Tax=Streptomyces profundus TaxID=2867410 RepID=UPI001D166010|nr:hypothetical protein [Streptomyces sp. MA3_2.13]UED85058.1 hypothetical protein K4G22_13325 [Streptomyces sp. MA3_2.13]
MRKSRVVGIIASSAAAVGLTALAITSANAAADDDGPANQPAETEYQPTEPGPPADLEPGVSVQRTEDGVEVERLTQEEVDGIDGWQPVEPAQPVE